MAHDVGDGILIRHRVRDADDCELTNAATVVLTVTLPDLGTEHPAVANPPEETGLYEVIYTLTQPGRYVFAWVTTDPDTAEAVAVEATQPGALPDLVAVAAYLQDSADQWTDAELTAVLAAEVAAQARVCRIRAEYPQDLREALLRRVARNLALRALPLAVLQGDAEAGSTVLPGRDPEVRRLEAPHRRLVVR